MTSQMGDSNPFRRSSLSRSETSPSHMAPSTNSLNLFMNIPTTEPRSNIRPASPATIPASSEPDPEPITPPTPAYTRVPASRERTLMPPRNANQRSLEIPPVFDCQAPAVIVRSMEGEDVPPPYELHAMSGKEAPSRGLGFESWTQRRPLQPINRPSLQSLNNITTSGSGFGNRDRRMNEDRENAEAQRRDLEKQNRKRHQRRRRGGIWVCVVCCLPTRRKQAKTASKKQWLILAGLCLLAAIITITVLVAKSTKQELKLPSGKSSRPSLFMLELPGLPPIPTGLGVVQPAFTPMKGTSCYRFPSIWSCNLPPPSQSYLPEFLFEIKHRKSDPYGQGAESLWKPSPSKLPSLTDLQAMGTRDKVTGKKEGEETEITISLTQNLDMNPVSATYLDSAKRALEQDLMRRQIYSIADPSQNPPNMLPTVLRNQPLRLYDRGLDSEHYAAYIYFHKHIYLNSLNDSKPATTNTEAIGSEAEAACTLRFTRFKLQIWTRKNDDYVIVDKEENRMGIDPGFGRMIRNDTAVIPCPVTLVEDRNGGPDDEMGRTTGCWLIVDDQDNPGRRKLGDSFPMSEKNSTGLQNGDRGCFCEWRNWREKGRLDVVKPPSASI